MTITTTDFIKTLFKPTVGRVYVCSFPNERDDPAQAAERHVITRMPGQIDEFVSKWDKAGRGGFFCVGTVGNGKRNKANVEESIGLHADIDFKSVEGAPDMPEVLRQIARLKYQPSALVSSGGGVHAYWLFKEPLPTQAELERIELALKQLADVVAGDLAVCEVARVMRLPGTHNTKNGAWAEVEVIELHDARRYELDDLEEWLSEQSPVMLRKARERGHTLGEIEEDYFAKYAREHGIKAPIDVEARLNGMIYMGGGDSSIHQTQLAVSASLLNQGANKDEVVALLLDATKRAAGDYGTRWNWRREERNIIKICDDWLRKHPPEKKRAADRPQLKSVEGGADQQRAPPPPPPAAPQPPSNVVPLKQVGGIIKKSEQHIELGGAVLSHIRDHGEELINTKDGSWLYSDGVWELQTENKWLDVRIEQACVGMGFKSGAKLINETRLWILRQPILWRKGQLPWDQHGKIPARNGLVDPVTGELERARPDHFCTWRVDVDYDPAAKCPWWETMIADMFDDKGEVEQRALVRVVQECMGAALIDKKSRALSKALVFWGIENLGKSGPLDVVTGLFGGAIGAAIGSLEGNHGMMPFTKRLPWILHEAFGGQWHFSASVKAIITQEPVMINIKNGPMLTAIVRAPIFWATNFQPQFKEATRAIVSRMIVIEVSRSFDEKSPMGAAKEALRRGFAKPGELVVATELPGVLNWAIAGLRRALERGSIELTASIEETNKAIHRDSNLVAGFLDECIEFDPKARIRVSDFCLAHSAWWMELKGEDRRLPTNEAISKAIKATGDGRIGADKEMRDKVSRYYCGIALNKAGLRFHRAAYESRLFEGKVATATNPDREVNSLIPTAWDDRPSVTLMRQRHGACHRDDASSADDSENED